MKLPPEFRDAKMLLADAKTVDFIGFRMLGWAWHDPHRQKSRVGMQDMLYGIPLVTCESIEKGRLVVCCDGKVHEMKARELFE